jgi:hypothetical protein
VTPPRRPDWPEPPRDRVELVLRGWLVRGALEETTGRNSISCSREQIGQF